MEFGSTKKVKKIDYSASINDNEQDITFYSVPPDGNIDLCSVDDMIEERLNILAVFDELKMDQNWTLNSNLNKYTDNLKLIKMRLEEVSCNFGENFIKVTMSNRSNDYKKSARSRDLISHFLLRLYYSNPKDPEKKNWFVARELDLLRFRLSYATICNGDSSAIPTLIERNGLQYEAILADRELKRKANYKSRYPMEETEIYRVLFEDALDIIRNRRVYLEQGWVYIPSNDMIGILCQKFKEELLKCMERLKIHYHEEEKRIINIAGCAHYKIIEARKKVTQTSKGNLAEMIKPEDIEKLAQESFPPCMENIHANLRKNHHLKYYGRLHYQLFLKGIGLTLEDALKFFRAEFIQKIPPEKFDKEYKYGIRYNYGKEGKKTNFSAYSCGKIINSDPPGPQDVHGCPFKVFGPESLRSFLIKKAISSEQVDAIVSLASDNHQYTDACTLYFKSRYQRDYIAPEGIKHPNLFFRESRRALLGYKEQCSPPDTDLIIENFEKDQDFS